MDDFGVSRTPSSMQLFRVPQTSIKDNFNIHIESFEHLRGLGGHSVKCETMQLNLQRYKICIPVMKILTEQFASLSIPYHHYRI